MNRVRKWVSADISLHQQKFYVALVSIQKAGSDTGTHVVVYKHLMTWENRCWRKLYKCARKAFSGFFSNHGKDDTLVEPSLLLYENSRAARCIKQHPGAMRSWIRAESTLAMKLKEAYNLTSSLWSIEHLIKCFKGLLKDSLTPSHHNFWATSNKTQGDPGGVFTDALAAHTTWGDEWGVLVHRWKEKRRRTHLVLEQKVTVSSRNHKDRVTTRKCPHHPQAAAPSLEWLILQFPSTPLDLCQERTWRLLKAQNCFWEYKYSKPTLLEDELSGFCNGSLLPTLAFYHATF